jgi:peptidoglycan/LPS O-acetylase OafA/YrhL
VVTPRVGVAAAAICALFAVAGGAQTTIYHGYTVAFSIASAFLVLAVVGTNARVFAPLGWRPVVYVGKLSYALYLWHEVVQRWITTGATRIEIVVLSFALAAASYHFVERPFLRRKWRLARTRSHDAPAEEASQSPPVAVAA